MPKYRIYTLSSDNGDGSSSVHKFATAEQAEAYIEAYNADSQEYCINYENLSYEDLEFDDNGMLMNPDVYETF